MNDDNSLFGFKARFTVKLQVDGGAVPNPGEKYGSYRVTGIEGDQRGIWIEKNRFPLGIGSNNEAEWEAMITAVHDLTEELNRRGLNPADVNVRIVTDSNTVLARFKNAKLVGSPDMEKLSRLCFKELSVYATFDYQWVPRIENVRVFGH